MGVSALAAGTIAAGAQAVLAAGIGAFAIGRKARRAELTLFAVSGERLEELELVTTTGYDDGPHRS